MLEHEGELLQGLVRRVLRLEIIHAHHGGLDACDTQPGVGLAIIAILDLEPHSLADMLREIELYSLADIISRGGRRWRVSRPTSLRRHGRGFCHAPLFSGNHDAH